REGGHAVALGERLRGEEPSGGAVGSEDGDVHGLLLTSGPARQLRASAGPGQRAGANRDVKRNQYNMETIARATPLAIARGASPPALTAPTPGPGAIPYAGTIRVVQLTHGGRSTLSV